MNGDDSLSGKIKHKLIGKPKDIKDPHLFHKLALIPILAWIGLGADGLVLGFLRPGRGLPDAGLAHLPGRLSGHRHGPHRLRHLLCL